jgi:hypothetical protein
MPHITSYSVMPIPPVEANTRWFPAGALRIGVQYRVLDDAIAAAADAQLARAGGAERGQVTGLDDRGVALHVCAEQDGEWREFLRFDCFQEDPHYHYVSHRERKNEMVHLDPIADGDALAWALERLRTRLPQMLARAGGADVVPRLDARALEDALPRVAEAAYRARYASDAEAVRAAALGVR